MWAKLFLEVARLRPSPVQHNGQCAIDHLCSRVGVLFLFFSAEGLWFHISLLTLCLSPCLFDSLLYICAKLFAGVGFASDTRHLTVAVLGYSLSERGQGACGDLLGGSGGSSALFPPLLFP